MSTSSLVQRGMCPVQGNSDLYGLGIRIGIYIQMLTVQLSGLLSAQLRVEDHIGQGTIIFVLSAAIVLVQLLHASIGGGGGDGPIEPVEVFPVLTLLLLQLGVCRVSTRNKLTMLIWVAELVGLAAMFGWFWWRGMDLLPRSCPDDLAFFFAKVSIWGWFRSFNKANSVLAAMGAAAVLLVYFWAAVYYCAVTMAKRARRRAAGDDDSDDDDGEDGDKRNLGLGTVDLVVNVGAIVYVEVSLRWNGITGVHSLDSPGQFMPLLIALGQFLSVLYSAAKYLLQLSADEHALDDEDDSLLECHHGNKARSVRGDTEDIAL